MMKLFDPQLLLEELQNKNMKTKLAIDQLRLHITVFSSNRSGSQSSSGAYLVSQISFGVSQHKFVIFHFYLESLFSFVKEAAKPISQTCLLGEVDISALILKHI